MYVVQLLPNALQASLLMNIMEDWIKEYRNDQNPIRINEVAEMRALYANLANNVAESNNSRLA